MYEDTLDSIHPRRKSLEYCIIPYKPNAPAEKDVNLHEKRHLDLILKRHKDLDRRRENEIHKHAHQVPAIRNKRAAEKEMDRWFSDSSASEPHI